MAKGRVALQRSRPLTQKGMFSMLRDSIHARAHIASHRATIGHIHAGQNTVTLGGGR